MIIIAFAIPICMAFAIAIYFAYQIGIERGRRDGLQITVESPTVQIDEKLFFSCALNNGWALVKLSPAVAKVAKTRQ